jgi:hypothetical protein
MPRTRVTIGQLMLATLFVALNLTILKACIDGIDSGDDLMSFHLQALAPLINLVVISLIFIIAQIRQKGYCRPAHLGVQLFGWASLLLYLGCFTLTEDVFTTYRRATRQLFHSAGLFGPGPREGDAISQMLNAMPMYIFCFWLPQVLFVTVGGMIFSLMGVSLVRGSMLEKGRAWEAFIAEREESAGKG